MRNTTPLLYTALLLCVFVHASQTLAQVPIRLERGLVISESVRIAPDTYYIESDSMGAIVVRGSDITVDFGGATLIGTATPGQPDTFSGTGIRISGSNVTIVNAVVRGYRIGIWATQSDGLHVSKSDLSYNYRQKLKSTIEREHIDDWMSYHQNEHDEWMRYGAAVYIRDSDNIQIDSVTVTGGQNGLMLTDVNHAIVVANDITFNSGIGIGMYRSSENVIQHNRLDWNVRGHSEGFYFRGQDSAAILLYEQSSRNVIAYNSATHSGDGLFLWAGQSTMDSGAGGCNDNLIYGNDFSFAPTNGIEITFSRNTVVGNTIRGCWHGIWGGYSFDTRVVGNTFADNGEHIAIEHGQEITITGNRFTHGDIGIRLWERSSQPADWGYAQARDVDSRDFRIAGNTFESVPRPLEITDTDEVVVTQNLFEGVVDSLVLRGSTGRFDLNSFPGLAPSDSIPVVGLPAGSGNTTERLDPATSDWTSYAPRRWNRLDRPVIPSTLPQGRRYMMIDEWGPYDFRSPVFWPRSSRTAPVQHLETYGPPGTFRILDTSGIDSVSESGGSIGDTLTIWLDPTAAVDVRIDAEYHGAATTDRFGTPKPAGDAVGFSYRYFFAPIRWTVRFYEWDDETDPRTQISAFEQLVSGDPIAVDSTNSLAYQWYRSPIAGVRADRFATVSTGTVRLSPGNYDLEITSDDGVRVWIDQDLVHDDWTYHAPRTAVVPFRATGSHTIRIEHFEIDGYATIIASVRKR